MRNPQSLIRGACCGNLRTCRGLTVVGLVVVDSDCRRTLKPLLRVQQIKACVAAFVDSEALQVPTP